MGAQISTKTKILIAVLGLVLYLLRGKSKNESLPPPAEEKDVLNEIIV